MEPEENVDKLLRAEYILKIGNYLSSVCPPSSRFYMCNLEKKLYEVPNMLKDSPKLPYQYCHHCGSIWSSENCTIRVRTCQPINYHMKKLLNLEGNQPWKLNNHQKKKLRRFRESTSKIVYNCFICKMKTSYTGSKKSDTKYNSFAQTSNTPLSKIKLKKGDLNAGLFIPSTCSIDSSGKNNLKKSQISEKIEQLGTSLKNKERSQQRKENVSEDASRISTSCKENKITPKTIKSVTKLAASNAQKQSVSKKKKSLLVQILEQEQNKKKKNLSSFLVSL